MGFPGGSVLKNLPANAGDGGSIPVSGRSPGEGIGNPLQYSCLKNFMDRGPLQSLAPLTTFLIPSLYRPPLILSTFILETGDRTIEWETD